MKEIDFTADSPDQLYAILKDFPNQDDSESVAYQKENLFNVACEALRPFTFNSSNKTKLELLQLALDYHLKLGRGNLNFDFVKFAVYVLQDHRVDYKETERFFTDEIKDLTEPNCVNRFLDVGVKCLEQHLSLGRLSQMDVNGEFDELERFCNEVMEIEGIRAHGIRGRLREFLEKRSEEE